MPYVMKTGCEYPNTCYGPPDFSTPVPRGKFAANRKTLSGFGSTDPSSWSNTEILATVGVGLLLVGVLFVGGTGPSRECKRLERLFTDNWLEYGSAFAMSTKREALAKGCAWAKREVTERSIMREQY